MYIQKGSAFFKYYLKILIRMAIMPHTRAKTELRHGRPNLLQSVINIVSLAAVFSIVTQRSSPQQAVCGEERCVMILKTAARETIINTAKQFGKCYHLSS